MPFRVGGRAIHSETVLSLGQDPHKIAVAAEATIDDLQQYLVDAHHQRDTPILLFIEHHV